MSLTLQSRQSAVVYGAPPRANLLPPAETERRSVARLQRRWIAGVLAALLVMALIIAASVAMRVQAGMGLSSAEDQKADLGRQLAAYSEVAALVSERDLLTAKRAEALAEDMGWRTPYRLLTPALPAGAQLTGFSATTGGATTSKPGELGLKAMATVVSSKPIDQAIVLDRFAGVNHVVDVDMLGLEQAEDVYTYSIYVAFDQGLYNGRFQTTTAGAETSGDDK